MFFSAEDFVKSGKSFTTVNSATTPQPGTGSYSVQGKGRREKMDSKFGGFERHTKGIGMFK